MKIIIAGAGQVGVALAKYLREENHDIVLIDKSAERLGNLAEQLDIQTIEGSAAYPAVLEKAGGDHADIFLAVTGNDETNIVSCGVAKSVFNIQKRIARISSNEYLAAKYKSFLQSQSIEVVISPEVETAHRIMQILPLAGAVEMVPLSDGGVRFVGLKCKKTSTMVGKSVAQIHRDFEGLSVKIVAITRRFQSMNLDNTLVRSGDEVYFVIDKRHLVQALDILGYESASPRYII
ncbi:MAG: NAD-binding protein, partial [Alphaproteobacteria bacterium]